MRIRKILSLLVCAVMIAVMLVPVIGTATVNAATEKTVYLSSAGSDTNDGSESAPFATLQKAWTNSNTGKLTIVVLDNVVLDVSTTAFTFGSENKASETVIRGATASTVLDLSAKTRMALYGGGSKITFDNIKLKFDQTLSSGVPTAKFYCNGKHVIITETVSFVNKAPINIFAGGNGIEVASTRLEVYGGYYYYIYGGGENYPVTGDVNLTIGGNINAGENIDDTSSNVAQARIYGGGYKGAVGGDVNINYGGNAIARVLTGTGRDGGEVGGKININMTGGKVTTISATKTVHDKDAEVYINVTGGLCEAIFGGGESCSITGNVQIYLGANAEVSRRVFGGCYNDTNWLGLSFNTSNHVIGSVTVLVEKGAKVGTGTGLSSPNKIDMGLYSSSRHSSAFSDEICTLVFLNGNSASNYKIGGAYTDRSDYKVTVGNGGTVESAMNGTAALKLLPDEGKAAVIGSEKFASGQIYSLSASATEITFADIISYDITLDYNNGNGSTVLKKVEGGYVEIPKLDITNGSLELIGWATSANATEAEYVAGDKYTADRSMTLYAVWRGKPQQYNVMHMLVNGDKSKVYKAERLTGYVGWKTEATALDILGYTAVPVTQETIVANETVMIMVMYQQGDYALGDINCDGSVDPLDEAVFARYLAGWDGYDSTMICNYTDDCDGNGTVDSDDADYLAKVLAGWDGYSLN